MTLVLIRGGGDLASGVALRLHRTNFEILILELEKPLAVRRTVSFSQAVYDGSITIEGVTGRASSADQYSDVLKVGEIPVVIDPDAQILSNALLINPKATIVIDARLIKEPPEPLPIQPALHIGLGPGFIAGENCHAVIETRRSHTLGRVYWEGSAQADSRQPEGDPRRVLRSTEDGFVIGRVDIGDHIEEGQVIAELHPASENDQTPTTYHRTELTSPFKGVLRGLIHPSVKVTKGMKIGDIDPRDDKSACYLVSDKALSIGGGILEAVFSRPEFRETDQL